MNRSACLRSGRAAVARQRARSLAAGACLLVSACTQQAPTPAAAAAFTHVRSLGGIDEYRLDRNGLSVLLARDPSAPVVTFNITYRVGSRNEVTGTTGATHLLEHLMFKGSDRHNKEDGTGLSQYLERVGAGYNASTWFDRTNYHATLGRDHIDGYMAIEADRMRHLRLREADRQSEMTVVRNEFERGKNDPDTVLWDDVLATAFQALPYHHSTIGWKSDIEKVPIEKLRAFYDTYYWPNNATVIVAGDFQTRSMLETIHRHYGGYPASPQPIPGLYTEEPEQSGPRRVIVKRPGALGSLLIVHKVPDARHADQAALAVLDGILGSGKSARLYRALVDAGLALEASAGTLRLHDLSVHALSAALAPGAAHEQVERTVLAEVERIRRDGVSEAEVARVKRQTLAEQAYRRDGTLGVVSDLSEAVAAGDWTLSVRFPEQIAQVTPADVRRVAATWLGEDQSTTGWHVPTEQTEQAL